MTITTANVFADQNQTGHWMSSVSHTPSLVYKAIFTASNSSFVYYGTSEKKFKTQNKNHKKS